MLRKLILAATALAGLSISANAADILPPPPDQSDWVFTVAPYAWLAGLNGDVAAFGAPEVDIDVSFSDVLQHLDIGFMGAAEARNGPFSIATDLVWAKISGDAHSPHGILFDKVDLTVNTVMWTGVAGYSLFYSEGGNLDVVAGARLWSVANSLNFDGGLADGLSPDDNQTWVDPLVGLKGRANINEDFYLTGWALAGGFGVSSEFMWDAMGSVGYNFNDSFSMTVGYRGVGVNYSNGGFVYDIVQQGPMLGAIFKF